MTRKERWKEHLESVSERFLPFDRKKLPPVPSDPSDEDVVEFLKVAKPLIERGRWWYSLKVKCSASWKWFMDNVVRTQFFMECVQIYAALIFMWITLSLGRGENLIEALFDFHAGLFWVFSTLFGKLIDYVLDLM